MPGYSPKTVRLHGFADASPELDARCQQLQAEMEAWLAGQDRTGKVVKYDGTFGSLLTLYETHKYSPYRRLSRHSKEAADYELRKLRRVLSDLRISKLNGMHFTEWYWKFRAPADEGGPEGSHPRSNGTFVEHQEHRREQRFIKTY
jgi:hypothetical protein